MKNNMATHHPLPNMNNLLLECGVKIISLPGGFVQLLGKYGSILLTNDITALKAWQLEQLCGVQVTH